MKYHIALIFSVLLLCGCKNQIPPALQDNATVMLTAEASVFMSILKEKGAIPEIPADRHGNLESGMMCAPKQYPDLPFNTQFHAVMYDAPDATYYFIVTKDNPTAPWTMSKAWKESAGKKMDLALPSADLQNVANEELLQRKK